MGVRRSLLTAGFVVAAVTGMWMHAAAQGPPTVATIVLTMGADGCEKTLIGNDPDPAHKDRIRAKRNNTVRWRVSNNTCTGSVEVILKDWTPTSPFGSATLKCSASPGNTCVMSARVQAEAQITAYKYAAYIGGTKKDPDLIIDP